ncbi:MAG: ATP-binding cassette domain-containing protein [Gammaproteobacteria bacterium]|nr:MAG: ATP-binding cassette domain-containing protein [Gammaproteobacteria bacterium]
MPNAIQANGLIKSYAGRFVVDQVDLDIPAGSFFGILGPNGAGKTTTLRMIQGVTPPDAGCLSVLGLPVPEKASQARTRMGIVPQTDNLDPDFTVKENLQVYGSYFRIDRQTLEMRITELLDFVELCGYENANVHTLSGGMQRRLVFARALINDPDLIILDEPTTGLDPQARHLIWQKLRELMQQGKTLLLTTHYMEEAQRLCDELVIIDHGKVLERGEPAALTRRHIEPEVLEIHDNENAYKVLQQCNCGRTELVGGSVYGYMADASFAINALHEAGIAYLQRPANLEDVFLKLTGRELRG